MNSVSGYGGIEIMIVEIKCRDKTCRDKSSRNKNVTCIWHQKNRNIRKYIDDDVHHPRIDKEALFEPWIPIYSSEEKNNQKASILLDGKDPKTILTKMIYKYLIDINDRHKILGLLIKAAPDRINELKKALVINKSVEGAPDGSGELYQIIDGQRIPDSLTCIYNAIIEDGSFSYNQLLDEREKFAEAYVEANIEKFIKMAKKGLIKVPGGKIENEEENDDE